MAKSSEHKASILSRTIQGRIVPLRFFVNHWSMICLVLIIAIIYISTKYTCQTRVEKIMYLTKELNNAKTDYVKASSEFKSQIRETKMRNLVDTMRIDLTSPDQPPYKLTGK
jgi:hypothetical protein